MITEGTAIVQYIADKNPPAASRANGTIERTLCSRRGFHQFELHKTIGGCSIQSWTQGQGSDRQRAETRLDQLSAQMAGKQWIANDAYSVADAYCSRARMARALQD